MKNKNLNLFLIIVIIIGVISMRCIPTKADSGWDSSYDSGGWDSGSSSSWDSNSSWSSRDSHSSNYSSGSSTSIGDFIIIVIVLIIFLLPSGNKKGIKTAPTNKKKTYFDMDDKSLEAYGINKEEFKKMVFEKYVEIQKAWMDFDYETLKKDLTDELYNSYVMQLEALKVKKQKNIMSDFENLDVKILNVFNENDVIRVQVYLNVSMYDYVVDENMYVKRGNKISKIDIEYLIDFVRNSKVNNKCPKCGAEIDEIVSGECPYCRTKIYTNGTDYVMSKKTNVGQRSR